ncbi:MULTISPECIES: hypothetical protein [unclassified Leeuwenhoekiella]|uniref:hypothetical protein n=2 Tax=Leeuwenhoekiella TaxID=283735 RepID=UPI000C432079|nr:MULTISPECIES: hypothetical protein [unclassified Leeuwenhoekiella]MAW93812.1 hypothetical protein [Leeuwenhoekiella sp.]MBA82219.1 hypothetical protein [Leeuwenhoekiella sp.]
MKTDKSIRNITIASINRKAMDIDSWNHSRIADENDTELIEKFELSQNELPVFEIKSELIHTLISTRQIIERTNEKIQRLNFEFLDDVVYGNFKGRPNKPELTVFRVVDIHGDEFDFQMETGKASIGLIYSVDTIRQLRADD